MKKTAVIMVLGLVLILVLSHIEFCFGRCLDNDGNGKAYNGESCYNYISYKSTEATENDIVMTVFWKVNGEYEDRADFIILKDCK